MCALSCGKLVITGRPALVVIQMCQLLSKIDNTIIDKNSIYKANMTTPVKFEQYKNWCKLCSNEACNMSKITDLTEEDFNLARTFLFNVARLRADVICEQ